MPIYEYTCAKCGKSFELLRSMNKCNENADCPDCGVKATRKISAFRPYSKDETGFQKNSLGSHSAGDCKGCNSGNCGSCG